MKLIVEKNVPTDPAKWSYYKAQAKKKFDVYPSAYANGWAAKQYKAAGGGWKTEESVDEAKENLGFEVGDFVHFKSKNKTGMVLKIQGNKVTIKTLKGPFVGDIKDIQILAQDNINEGNAFTGALFNARKEGLKEFEFNGKKYPVITEVDDDDDEPPTSSVKKAGKEQAAQKKEMLSIQKTLKDNAKDTAAFSKIPQNKRTASQKAHLKKMADLTTKLKKLKSLTEDIDVGHQDDEPNMLKADLFRIAKYAKELYEMLNQFDNSDEEIDFPHWWQSDIIRAKELMVNAKHYLNGELNVNGNPLGESKKRISEGLEWHLKNKKPLSENVFRYGSPKFFKLVNECRGLWRKGQFMPMNESDEWFLDSDLGKIAVYEGKKVLLDFPVLVEAEYQGREVELNSPKRNPGEGKKYVVYVKDPSSDNIRKVTFGDVKGGLTAKINDPEARKAFSDRHNCPEKTDKTSPGYWSCNLPRHWSKIGGGEDINSYW